MSTCGIGFTIVEGNDPTVFFSNWDADRPSSCPKCGRLFPLAAPEATGHRKFVTFSCNRPDPHERIGEHWYEFGGVRMSLTITGKEVWMAGCAAEPGASDV